MSCRSCEEKRKRFEQKLAQEIANKDNKNKERKYLKIMKGVLEPYCIFVTGLESSGNRYLTKALIEMGCNGSSAHSQPFLDNVPEPSKEPRLVIRMSLPHGGSWNIPQKIIDIQTKGYKVYVLNVVRDYFPCMRSSIANKHIKTEVDKIQQLNKAYSILGLIPDDVPIFPITYQGLSNWGTWAWISTYFGLSNPLQTAYKDEDTKHYEKFKS